jgi:hypothetical protein
MGLLLFERSSLENETGEPVDKITAVVNRKLDMRRERISYALDHIADYASAKGHYYIFAHIYLPHFPFLYGPGGEELHYHENINLYWFEVEPDDYLEYYIYQIEYLNYTLLRAIDRILEDTTKSVIIVLQSDHGDDIFLDWDSPTTQGVHVRSAILNAIFYSDRDYENLYYTLTPVNTYRLILNHWFGTKYGLLPDVVYFHEHSVSTPHTKKPEFINACKAFNICLTQVND